MHIFLDFFSELSLIISDFIAINPPRWEGWKKKRDLNAVDAAARMNPKVIV